MADTGKPSRSRDGDDPRSDDTTALTMRERERLTETLHAHIGHYVSPEVEEAFAETVERIIEARLAPLTDLAAAWQAEVEDDGDGLTSLATVLAELRAAATSWEDA